MRVHTPGRRDSFPYAQPRGARDIAEVFRHDVATATPIEKSSGDTLARKKRKLEAKAAHAARVRDAIDSDSQATVTDSVRRKTD